MKKVLTSVACAVCALMLTGCAMVNNAPTTGFVYQSQKGPGLVTSNSLGHKVGTSEATSILGIYASGDASIDAAAKAAYLNFITKHS